MDNFNAQAMLDQVRAMKRAIPREKIGYTTHLLPTFLRKAGRDYLLDFDVPSDSPLRSGRCESTVDYAILLSRLDEEESRPEVLENWQDYFGDFKKACELPEKEGLIAAYRKLGLEDSDMRGAFFMLFELMALELEDEMNYKCGASIQDAPMTVQEFMLWRLAYQGCENRDVSMPAVSALVNILAVKNKNLQRLNNPGGYELRLVNHPDIDDEDGSIFVQDGPHALSVMMVETLFMMMGGSGDLQNFINYSNLILRWLSGDGCDPLEKPLAETHLMPYATRESKRSKVIDAAFSFLPFNYLLVER